jgi:hydrogenase maturation protease
MIFGEPHGSPSSVLLVAYGNEYRGDDGLGQYILARVKCPCEKQALYELTLEQAEEIRDYQLVVFIDASLEGEEVQMRRLVRRDVSSPLSHHLPPEKLLHYVWLMYHKEPEAWLLSVRGYDFDFTDQLSPQAQQNTERAIELLEHFLSESPQGRAQYGH